MCLLITLGNSAEHTLPDNGPEATCTWTDISHFFTTTFWPFFAAFVSPSKIAGHSQLVETRHT